MTYKIAFACSGEGHGHAARVVALADKLKLYYHIEIWAPKSVHKFFYCYLSGIPLHDIPNLILVKKNHKVLFLSTIWQNWKTVFNSFRIIRKLQKELKAKAIDFVISDYEPFLCRAAKYLKLPVLLVNHQGIFNRINSWKWEHLLVKLINRLLLPSNLPMLVSSFYGGDIGPIIRPELKNYQLEKRPYILVYAKEDFSKKIKPLLAKFPEIHFEFFNNSDRHDFLDKLTQCSAIIAPAGHQLICEAICLHKPILVVPEENQYEQILNAKMLALSGRGMYSNLNQFEKVLKDFIHKLPAFPLVMKTTKQHFILKDDTDRAVEIITSYLEESRKELIWRKNIEEKSKPLELNTILKNYLLK